MGRDAVTDQEQEVKQLAKAKLIATGGFRQNESLEFNLFRSEFRLILRLERRGIGLLNTLYLKLYSGDSVGPYRAF